MDHSPGTEGPHTQRPESPLPSCVSMKSDRSMDAPLKFSNGANQHCTKPHTQRPESPLPSCVSMKSDRSMDAPLKFSNGANQHCTDGCSLNQVQSRCGMCKQELGGQNITTCGHCRDPEKPEESRRTKLLDHVMKRILMTHKASIKRRFENISEGITRPGTQTLLNDIYTELYITEGESEGVNKEHEVCQVELESRPQTTEDTAINCNDIFKPLPEEERHIKTVMTKGIAGIGKTISVQKFILDWAEEKANQDVHFMFVLPFRELNLVRHDQYSLHKLLLNFHPELKELQEDEYKDCHIAFIFDGLDESRLPLSFQENQKLSDVTQTSSVDVLMTSLIQGTLLPSALIWITSRPAAASQIPSQCISLVTEVRGFSDTQKVEYFRKKISDGNQANKIISHIKASRSLHIMCHIPVFCWISATVLQHILKQDDGKEIPKTLTEMYIHFLLIQTTRKNQKYQDVKEADGQRFLESRKLVILKLAELAFWHLENGNLMFYEEDLRECGIDVNEATVYSGMCTEIFREESVFHHKKVYCFVHLSIQEFLAALHLFASYLSKNIKALKPFLSSYQLALMKIKSRFLKDKLEDVPIDELADVPLDELLKSAANKALKSKNGHLDLFVRFLHGISLESNQRLLSGLLTHTHSIPESVKDVIIKNLKMMERPNISPERCINLFHCLVEMHDSSVHEEIQAFLKAEKGSVKQLSLVHCSALAHVLLMADEVLDEFDLNKYKTSPEGSRRLIPAVRHCRKALLAGCDLTETSCETVASALQSVNSVLRVLDLSHNDLQESGEKLFTALQSPNCKLETLRLAGCNLTETSCKTVSSVLQSSVSLIELDLGNNDLKDSGVEFLSVGLSDPHCKLQTLRLAGCNLTETSCKIVSFVLQSSVSLIELDLSENRLKNSGVKFLTVGLSDLHFKLQTLRLAGCNLTETSCKTVSSVLQSSVSLKELDLSNNNLKDFGVEFLSVGLSDPHCKLQTLRLAGCNLTETSCKIVSSVLQSLDSLIELDLSNNDLKDSGVEFLSVGLRNPHCKLQTLRLAGCNLTETSCKIVSSVVKSSVSLIELDLSNNDLKESGVEFLSVGLSDPHCKLQTLRLAGCYLTETSCKTVSSVLQSSVSLLDLDLSSNDLEDSGVEFLSVGLSDPHCKLQTLRLSGCLITHKGCSFLASALKSNPSYLKELDLSYNHPGDSGIRQLTDRLNDPNCKLETLRFDHGGENRMRPGVRKYACDLTLDINTAHISLSLSEENRKVTCMNEERSYPEHPERFVYSPQVLCNEGLSGRHYWEIEWSGFRAAIAVTYKSVERNVGRDTPFGFYNKFWCLICTDDRYYVRFKRQDTDIPLPSPHSHRVGVYLDCLAGTLSFYSVSSDTLTHLYTVHSTFTEPLYPGFGFWFEGKSSVTLCQIT